MSTCNISHANGSNVKRDLFPGNGLQHEVLSPFNVKAQKVNSRISKRQNEALDRQFQMMLDSNSTDLKRGRHCIWTVLLLFSPAIPCIVPSERVPSSNSTSSGLFLQHNPRQLKCSLLLPKIGGLRNSLCRKAGLHTPSSPSLRSQACVLKMGIPYMYFLAN